MMKRTHLVLMSLLSGLLLSLSWPMHGVPVLLFVAFVPLLFIEEYFNKRKNSSSVFAIMAYVLPAFFVWNLLTTWWIVNSTAVGAALAIVLNSVFMTFFFGLFHLGKRQFPRQTQGYLTLIFYWITFELIHHHWDLNWPWLSLGNGFAAWNKWIQWYEFTGMFGGTLWILVVNILVFQLIKSVKEKKSKKNIFSYITTLTLVIVVPLSASLVMYKNWEVPRGKPVDVVVVQPNLDPYAEQYELPPLEVADRVWNLALKEIDDSVRFIVCPESAIQEYVWEDHLNYAPSVSRFRENLSNYPGASLIIGLSSRKMLDPAQQLPPSARKYPGTDLHYNAYNTALIIDTSQHFQVYHKSKLTPGVEVMPLVRYVKFIEKLAIDLGGTVGSLGIDPVRTPFSLADGLKIGTAICYESAYGEFMAGFVRNGANLIFVITNDGWWKNTPGHRQHLLFSSIRAIEMRRAIARSANTGISCFVNQRGDIQQATSYWQPDAIRQKIYANTGHTFYVRYGDYIARASVFGAVLMFLITVMLKLKSKKNKL